MKKLITPLLILLMLPFAFAQETDMDIAGGILPDSPLYFIDVAIGNIQVALANAESKPFKRLEIAQERVAELKLMLEKENSQAVVLVKAEYEKELNLIDMQSSNISEEKKEELQIQLQRHVLTLENILEKVPLQAKSGIQNALDNSQKVRDTISKRLPPAKRLSPEMLTDNINKADGLTGAGNAKKNGGTYR